jgi:protein translocase SecG subunit
MMLPIAQIIVSVLLVTLILLQERSGGISGLLGGGEGGFYQARRGLEKTIFIATIVLAVVFVALAIAQVLA